MYDNPYLYKGNLRNQIRNPKKFKKNNKIK